MSKNIIIKSLVESLIGWVLLALVMCLTRNITFVQALIAPYSIGLAVSAFVGCCIGYQRKLKKMSQFDA